MHKTTGFLGLSLLIGALSLAPLACGDSTGASDTDASAGTVIETSGSTSSMTGGTSSGGSTAGSSTGASGSTTDGGTDVTGGSTTSSTATSSGGSTGFCEGFLPPPLPETLEDGVVGEPYEVQFTMPGVEQADAVWSTDDELPAGLSLDADTGVLSGAPELAGETVFGITGYVKEPPDDCALAPGYTDYVFTVVEAP